MLEQNIYPGDIRPLKFCYIFHFILYIFIFILHFVLYNRLFWLNNVFEIIFNIITYFIILFYLIPLIPMILLSFKYYKLKIFRLFKNVSLIFLILTIILGLITCIIFWINTFYSITFYKECPLSYTKDNLNYTFSKYNGHPIKSDKIENKCNTKRCILFDEDINEKYAYTYLCNYELNNENDSNNAIHKNEFKRLFPNGSEIISDNEFICYQLEPALRKNLFNNNIYYDYIDLCSYCTNFYICERFSEPHIYYTLKNDEICPEDNYLVFLYIISVLIIITDIMVSLLPWFIEYISFKKILSLIEINESRNSSNATSKKSTGISNSNSNSNSNKSESFKKEETLIIVSPLNKKNNKKEDNKSEI